jgi:hypothetical protein
MSPVPGADVLPRVVRIAVLPALVAAMVGAFFAQGAPSLPSRLAGLQVTRTARGPQGLAEVERLHRRAVALRSGEVAEFGARRATLWVGVARGENDAATLTRDMTARLIAGGTPFQAPLRRTVRGREVWESSGLGQRHAWFRSGARVIWLAADSALFERALPELMKRYR